MKINIKTISEVTGFSQATVSNALNNKRGVNRETAERIIAVARDYGYISESRINNIKLVIYKSQGVVVSDTPFFSELIEGVCEESRAAGYEATIFNLDRRDPNYEQTRDQLLNDANSAIILLATEMNDEDIEAFKGSLAPVLVLDNWLNGMAFNSVLISNEDSAYQATKYLIDKGHTSIGYLMGNTRISNFVSRGKAFHWALQDAKLKENPNFMFELTPTMDGAYNDMCAHLSREPELPTAFFADNDIIALGAMKALTQFGYRIPEDVSIIGFDDMPYGRISSPPLTTIRVFKQEMARIAVKTLIDVFKSESKIKRKIHVCTAFIERESVADINK